MLCKWKFFTGYSSKPMSWDNENLLKIKFILKFKICVNLPSRKLTITDLVKITSSFLKFKTKISTNSYFSVLFPQNQSAKQSINHSASQMVKNNTYDGSLCVGERAVRYSLTYAVLWSCGWFAPTSRDKGGPGWKQRYIQFDWLGI